MEKFPQTESFLDRTVKKMSDRGYQLVSVENIGIDKFNTETAKFITVATTNVDEIKNRYSKDGEFEVELIERPNVKIEELLKKGIIDENEASSLNVPESQKSYLVFVKPLAK